MRERFENLKSFAENFIPAIDPPGKGLLFREGVKIGITDRQDDSSAIKTIPSHPSGDPFGKLKENLSQKIRIRGVLFEGHAVADRFGIFFFIEGNHRAVVQSQTHLLKPLADDPKPLL